MKKNIVFVLILCMALFTGCTSAINLNAEENDLVAEYAAGMLLPYSYLYENRYDTWKTKDEEPSTENNEEEPTTEEPSVENPSEEESSGDGENTGDPVIDPSDENPTQGEDSDKPKLELSEALGTHPVDIVYNNYVVCDAYDIAGGLFEIRPEEGCKFVVISFILDNKSFESVTVNTHDKGIIIRGIFNEEHRYNNYDASMLTNDLTVLKDVTLESGEEYEALVMFMIPSEVADSIESFSIEIATDMSEEGELILK